MISDWDSDEARKELGQKIQKMRERAGVTQLQLAEAAGCTKNYVSAVERGVNKLTVPLLMEYCKALDCTPDDILG